MHSKAVAAKKKQFCFQNDEKLFFLSQQNIVTCRALSPSAFGELVVMALKMLTRTRNRVTSKAIRPCKAKGNNL